MKYIMRGSTGGGAGGPDSPENHKNIEFFNNTGPDPLKITKLPSQQSMLGHYRHARETLFKWRFAGVLIMAWYLDSLYPHKLKKILDPRMHMMYLVQHTRFKYL